MAKCETEVYKFDKDVWKLYDSATVHNVQRRFPKKLLWVPVLFLVGGGLAYTAYANLQGMTDEPLEETPSSNQKPLTILEPSEQKSQALRLDTVAYLSQYVPRVEGQPWTAPRYDDLNKPAAVPKPAGCIHNRKTNVCRCITQQGTPLAVKRSFCLAWMDNTQRFFDDTVSDDEYANGPTRDKNFEGS